MNNFASRSLTGILFVIVLISGIVLHPLAYGFLFLIITILSLHEYVGLALKKMSKPQRYIYLTFGGLIFISTYLYTSKILPITSMLIIPALFIVLLIIEIYKKHDNPLKNIALQIFGFLYIVVPLSLMNFMQFSPDGMFQYQYLLSIFILIWSNDTGAYISGLSFGRHKFWERISPKKTWEGTIGGIIITIGIAYVLSLFFIEISPLHWMIIGLVTSIAGIYGDLFESLIKRSLNIKDSGNILPGHGGMLDRFDSTLFVSPVVFIYLQLILN